MSPVRLLATAARSPKFWQTAFPQDEEIVQRVLAGELPLFEVLMRRHNQRVYRTIRSILKDDAEVEDVMQQSYASAYSTLRQFAGTARFSTWLTRIAINAALARRQRATQFASSQASAQRESETPMKLAGDDQNPEEQAARRELARMLESAIDALPDSFRAVVMLREIEGLSTAEAAEVLGVSEDVIKTRLHRAKEQIRDLLADRVSAQAKEAFPFYAPRCDRVVAAVFATIESLANT